MEEDSDLDDDLTRLAGRGNADAGPSSASRKRRSNAVLSDDDDDDDDVRAAGGRKRKQNKKREVRFASYERLSQSHTSAGPPLSLLSRGR